MMFAPLNPTFFPTLPPDQATLQRPNVGWGDSRLYLR
jgi:hypothetical protein